MIEIPIPFLFLAILAWIISLLFCHMRTEWATCRWWECEIVRRGYGEFWNKDHDFRWKQDQK